MQFISVGRTIGFRRLPVQQKRASRALADHKQRWSAPRKRRKNIARYL
jgi:hypothetical protein